MKKHFILLLSFALFPFLMNAQLNISWQNIIDDGASGNENSNVTVYDPNGYVYTIGIMLPSGMNNTDLVIVKYDAIGNEMWRTFYAGPSGKNEKIMDAVLDQNGDLVLCGEYFNTANNNDILVMKYSSNGGFLWMDTINGVGALFDQGKGVCVDDANNYYFTGYTVSGSYKAILLKYTAAGQQLWSTTYAGTQQGLGISYYDEHLYLHCMTGPTGSPTHASFMKLDTAGTIRASIGLNAYYGDFIKSVLIKDDRIYLLDARSNQAPLGGQYGIVCADTALQVLWDRNYSAGYYSEPIGLSLHDTLLYVAHTEYPGQTLSISSVKLRGISSLTGDSLFMNTVLSQSGQNDMANAQTIDNTGTISVFMDYELAPGVNRFQLARFDATGLQTGSFLFGDVPAYGETTLMQMNSSSLLLSSTVYDSVAFNTNISTWWISTPTSSLSTNDPKRELYAGPIPASDHLRLFGLPFEKFSYEILSPLGQVIDQGTLSEGSDRMLLNMKSGFYLLKLYSKKTVFNTTFIKQ